MFGIINKKTRNVKSWQRCDKNENVGYNTPCLEKVQDANVIIIMYQKRKRRRNMKTLKRIGAFLLSLVMVMSVVSGVDFTAKAAIQDNTLTVYYYNSWSNAYIHYQVDGQGWTSVPGVKMEKNYEQTGYMYKSVINLGQATNAQVCFNNGGSQWDSQNGANYKLQAGTYGIKNGQIKQLADEKKLSVSNFKINDTKGSAYGSFDINNGTAPYTYTIDVKTDISGINNGEGTFSGTTTTNYASFTKMVYRGGNYTFTINVTDANGQSVTSVQQVKLTPLTIYGIDTSVASPQKVGTSVTFTADYKHGFIAHYMPLNTTWTIKKSGKTVVDHETVSYGNTYTWNATEEGNYTVTVDMKDDAGDTATYSIDYTIKSDKNNQLVLYYYSNWSNTYAHYQPKGYNWTNVPGVAMEKVSGNSKYNCKVTIDLMDADQAQVCFNNGGSQWDSKNGSNYTIKAGTYGVKNGTVEEVVPDDQFRISEVKISTESKKYGYGYATLVNGTAPYSYTVDVKHINGVVDYGTTNWEGTSETDSISLSNAMHYSGDYVYTINVTDANGKKATATKTVNMPAMEITKLEPSVETGKVGTAVTFSAEHKNAFVVYVMPLSSTWTIEKDGKKIVDEERVNYGSSYTWTPTEEGNYKVTVTVRDDGCDVATKTINYKVGNQNTVTVYYKNTQWDLNCANIHYQVDGKNWTSVPGARMSTSDKRDYYWVYTIDLGDAKGAQVCFNNGSGRWDSKNGANYYVTAGTYGIKEERIIDLAN